MYGNFRPHRFVDLSVGYDFVTGAAHNIAIGANFNLGPVNLFVAADQVPLKWKGGLPVHTMGTHVSTGMNLLFGWTKGKQQQEVCMLESAPVEDQQHNHQHQQHHFPAYHMQHFQHAQHE